MSTATKITDTFVITSGAENYRVHEHTRCTKAKVNGVARETLGRAYYKTEDGRGVLKNADDNTYAIPSLGIKSARRSV